MSPPCSFSIPQGLETLFLVQVNHTPVYFIYRQWVNTLKLGAIIMCLQRGPWGQEMNALVALDGCGQKL